MHPSDLRLSLRPGHPDFLDLPWDRPLEEWPGTCARVEQVPRGPSRHPVVFVNYGGSVYALKELPPDRAEREYDLLRTMEDLRLPVVTPAGHARTVTHRGPAGVLVTRYLDRSLPYHLLFTHDSLATYRASLMDAMAGLLVQLHLAGVYWGDCSLANTLFRRDAGTLRAYLVDAETSEVREHLALQMREHDLDLMEENLYGALVDLDAAGLLPAGFPILTTGPDVRGRYRQLWAETTRDEILSPDERFRVHERIRALNALGFSVDEVELQAVAGGAHLRLRAVVADRNFHRDLLHGLTGLVTEEQQARQIVNEIQELKATLSQAHDRSLPLSAAAHHWLAEIYGPTLEQLRPLLGADTDPAEVYCQVLVHKWLLSEQARRDVGHRAAAEDILRRVARSTP